MPVTQMVCADQQIHSEEAKSLKKLAYQIGATQQTLEEMEKILAQDEQQISVEVLVQRISHQQRHEAFKQILAVADALATQVITSQIRQIADTEGIAIADMALNAIARLCAGGMRNALQLLA